MCGVCGVMTFKPLVINDQKHQIEKMISMMSRRGPDDEGIWTDNKHSVFGFRRLSILDLSPSGHQPMVTSDNRCAIVFNGEVYNFKEIRHELERKGIKFKSSGDAEVVLQSLAVWGKEALNKFNGMFALAFYDSKEKKLLLARDHAGIKPLYYLLNQEGVFFASQYDQIMAHSWAKKEKISQEALGLYLRFVYIPAPYGLLENTYLLEPGSWIEIDTNQKINQGRYYEFPKYQKPTLFGEEAYEAVDAAVSAAVKRQLVSDVPVGAFLSGGIDSPLVVANMKKAGASSLKTFTIGTEDSSDESADAARYAEQIGVEQIVKRFSSEQALSMLEDVVASCGEPFADYSIFPTMMVAKLARENGYKVMLSGDGGDELFWGYAERFGSVISKAEDFKQPHWYRSARWGMKKYFGLGDGYLNLRQNSIGDWYRAKHTRLSEQKLRQIFPDLPDYPQIFKSYEYRGHDPEECAQWVRWNEYYYHLGMVLMKVDRASMYHSVEVRVPLLDREVINVAAKIDWKSCLDLKNNIGKIPLRKSLAKHIAFQTKSKKGFNVPMGEWLSSSLSEVIKEKLLDRPNLCGLSINREVLADLFQEHCLMSDKLSHGLWHLLSLAFWEDRYC